METSVSSGELSAEREKLLLRARCIVAKHLAKHDNTVQLVERCLTARSPSHLAALLATFSSIYAMALLLISRYPTITLLNIITIVGCTSLGVAYSVDALQPNTKNSSESHSSDKESSTEEKPEAVQEVVVKSKAEQTCSELTQQQPRWPVACEVTAQTWVGCVLTLKSTGYRGDLQDWRVLAFCAGSIVLFFVVRTIIPLRVLIYCTGVYLLVRPLWIKEKLSQRLRPYFLQVHYLHTQPKQGCQNPAEPTGTDDFAFAMDTADMAASVQFEQDLVQELERSVRQESLHTDIEDDEEEVVPVDASLLHDSLLGLRGVNTVDSLQQDPWDFNDSLDEDSEFAPDLSFPSVLPDGRIRHRTPASKHSAHRPSPLATSQSTSSDAPRSTPPAADSSVDPESPVLDIVPRVSTVTVDDVSDRHDTIDLSQELAEAAHDISVPPAMTASASPDDFELISVEEVAAATPEETAPQQLQAGVLAAPGAYLKTWLVHGQQ